MVRHFDIHPASPERRAIAAIADIVREGGVIAYPTDSCYALGCQLGNRDGMARIRSIRGLDDRHHLTLVCQDFAQLGRFAYVANPVFRAIKAATPGSYTFILPATKEVPRILQHPRKKTVGVRIPRHVVTQALLAELGEPLVSSTLLLPDQDDIASRCLCSKLTGTRSVQESVNAFPQARISGKWLAMCSSDCGSSSCNRRAVDSGWPGSPASARISTGWARHALFSRRARLSAPLNPTIGCCPISMA